MMLIILTYARKVTCCICRTVFQRKCVALSPQYHSAENMISIPDTALGGIVLNVFKLLYHSTIFRISEILAEIAQSPSLGKSVLYLSDVILIPFELKHKNHSSDLRETDPDQLQLIQ